MKKLIMMTAVAGAVLLLAGCGDTVLDPLPGDGTVQITLTCVEPGTRTDEALPGEGNDDLIKYVDYFVFKAGVSACYHHARIEPGVVSPNYTFYIQTKNFVEGDYTVFTVVNYPEILKSRLEDPTIEMSDIDEIVLDEAEAGTFTAHYLDDGKHRYPSADGNVSLVMTGGTSSFHLASISDNITQNITLTRLPAKVTMDYYIKDEVVVTSGSVTETWTPMTEGANVRVYLCNGRKNALMGTSSRVVSPELFSYEPSLNSTTATGKSGYSQAFKSEPFYTYPRTWREGEADEPYLKLIVPWKVRRVEEGKTTESQKEFYYKVMLPAGLGRFESNHWYRLSLDVDRVGSDMEDAAVELTCSYSVADWGAPQGFTSDLVRGYYLDVNEGLHTLPFYGSKVEIPYFASGPVTFTLNDVTRKNYYNNTVEHLADIEREVQEFNHETVVTQDHDNSLIVINYTLNSKYSGDKYDVVPYEYDITLSLDGQGSEYDKHLLVTQYPPLYIESVDSDGKVFVKNFSGQQNSNNNSVYDDAVSSNPHDEMSSSNAASRMLHYMGTITTDIGSSGSQNNAIFEINATVLSDFEITVGNGEPQKVFIGDPRIGDGEEFTVNNEDFDFNLSGLDDEYRPTSNYAANIISPKFRIASSWGSTYQMSYEGALRRCAAYQENGYPAGRWRLPTAAEIEFLIKLSTDHKIIQLFNPGVTSAYWAGGKLARFSYGIVDMDGLSPSFNNGAVGYTLDGTPVYVWTRCVYDTWYWGSETTWYHDENDTPAPPYSASNKVWLGYHTATPVPTK